MAIHIKNISHKSIDSLSDGVFSIALTLLGLNVVSLIPKLSQSKNFNSALTDQWPTLLSFLLGFVVLFAMWYQYHVTASFALDTNAWVIWNHGAQLFWVALMPFAVALLASTLDTPNRKWGVFYFGVCLFGSMWSLFIFFLCVKFKPTSKVTADSPLPRDQAIKLEAFTVTIGSVIGIVLVGLTFVNPLLALAGYTAYILLVLVNPVKAFSRLATKLEPRL